jgi:hypothetical protein
MKKLLELLVIGIGNLLIIIAFIQIIKILF